MNKKIWIILGLALLCIVLLASAGCTSYRVLGNDGYANASQHKQETFGGNDNHEKKGKKGHDTHYSTY